MSFPTDASDFADSRQDDRFQFSSTNFSPRKVVASPHSRRFEKRMPADDSISLSSTATARSDISSATQQVVVSLQDILAEAELTHYFEAFRSKLKLQHAEHLRDVKDGDLSELGMSKPEQRRLWKVFHKRCPSGGLVGRLKRKVFARVKSTTRDEGSSRNLEGRKGDLARTQSLESHPSEQHIIPASSITLCKQLGSGEFGSVWQGVWSPSAQSDRLQVAVKCVSTEKLQSNPLDFLQEAAIMHKISHPHVVRLYGVVLETKSIMLVNELAPLRSLLECLREPNLRPSFPVLKLCDYAQQICEGMAYLESKRLIHRDLAARNILVFSTDKVKISDFGLSRALGVGEEYYRSNFSVSLKLPIAWCAPECITFLKFTSSSDVWALGVTLWEMFTYGFQPWAGMTGQQILDTIDTPRSHRLDTPDACPQEFYSLMLQCWEHDPNNRPKFSDILPVFPEIRPERVQAIQGCKDKQNDHLQINNGTIITVLNKRPKEYPDGYYWKGAVDSGRVGLFLPSNTVAYLSAECPTLPPHFNQTAINGSLGNVRASFGKSGGGGKSATLQSGGIKIDRSMISGPQGDVRHQGHVGIDKTGQVSIFGNIPKQIVNPLRSAQSRSGTNSPAPLEPSSNGRETVEEEGSGGLEWTTSESASLLGKDRAGHRDPGMGDPVVPAADLHREMDRSSPDLDIPKFENQAGKEVSDGGAPSLLDEVFEELERGSMSSRATQEMGEGGRGRDPLFSLGGESEASEPISPTSMYPVDTTDTTRLLGAGHQRNPGSGKEEKQGKPEALVRPLSFSDARLLNDFTHMAQKMADKTLKQDMEHRIQLVQQEMRDAELMDGGEGEGREKSPSNIRDRLAKLKVSRQSSAERESCETTPTSSERRTTTTFSENLPKKGADMFASTDAWTPMAEHAYKALIECGSSMSRSMIETSYERRSEDRETQGSATVTVQNSHANGEPEPNGYLRSGRILRQSSVERWNDSHHSWTTDAKQEEEESNPLRLLRTDAVGVARSFKPGGSRKGRAAFIPPIKRDPAPPLAHPVNQEVSDGGRRLVKPPPPPVPPKPKPRLVGLENSTAQHPVTEQKKVKESLAPQPREPSEPGKGPLGFTMESVDKYELLDFVLSALEKTKEEQRKEEEQRRGTTDSEHVQYVDLAIAREDGEPLSNGSHDGRGEIKRDEDGSGMRWPKSSGASPEWAGAVSLLGNNEDTVNL